MTKKILWLLLAMITTLSVSAQSKHVTWKYSSKTLENGNIELLFEATIADGFRLYSPFNPKGASRPLEITLEQSPLYTTVGQIVECNKPQEHYEEMFGVTEKFFKGNASFKMTIKPVENKAFAVAGKLTGQVCNDQFFCARVLEDFIIPVTPASSNTQKKKTVTGNKK